MYFVLPGHQLRANMRCRSPSDLVLDCIPVVGVPDLHDDNLNASIGLELLLKMLQSERAPRLTVLWLGISELNKESRNVQFHPPDPLAGEVLAPIHQSRMPNIEVLGDLLHTPVNAVLH